MCFPFFIVHHTSFHIFTVRAGFRVIGNWLTQELANSSPHMIAHKRNLRLHHEANRLSLPPGINAKS